MKILILGSAFSGLCQRVVRDLICLGHEVDQHYGMDEPLLRYQLNKFDPQIIICPFLTHRIPEDIWQSYRCLIVHPGIEGDRGASSLDWAISQQKSHWGVTLLQADAEMDAGDIWGTQNFILRNASKTSIYKREVTSAAVALIKQAVSDYQDPHFRPRPLNYAKPGIQGTLQPFMRQMDRAINWAHDTSATIIAKINAADTTPGLLDAVNDHPVHLFGASFEAHLQGPPGEVIAVKYGAICRATLDGAVWIRQAKANNLSGLPPIKLPAATVIQRLLPRNEFNHLINIGKDASFNDIQVRHQGDIAYIYFDFYNGAASTEQCVRLRETLITTKQTTAKTLVLMGGENFFGNGIHLNVIEAAEDSAKESWLNINAIDDLVCEIINSPNHLTIAALRNNAGAGGAIVALACDKVVGREGVVLNPHYNNMGLFGSEYWTYLLPKKIGAAKALQITQKCEPILASEALEMRYLDELFHENWQEFHAELEQFAQSVSTPVIRDAILNRKNQQRTADEALKPLAQYRAEELTKMALIFNDPTSYYHLARHNFVYKITPQNPCWIKTSSAGVDSTPVDLSSTV